jgi:hypothetical protein
VGNQITTSQGVTIRFSASSGALRSGQTVKEEVMSKFRKKPVVIEAMRWTGDRHREMFEFLGGKPDEIMSINGKNFYIDHQKVKGGLVIKTLEGEHIANINDWIIKGVKGEFYPCKPDIFEQTYEPVE